VAREAQEARRDRVEELRERARIAAVAKAREERVLARLLNLVVVVFFAVVVHAFWCPERRPMLRAMTISFRVAGGGPRWGWPATRWPCTLPPPLQKLAEVCIRRPVFASMLILALVVVGATAWTKLGVDRFPAVDLPQVSIRTELTGASPEENETEVCQRIEEVVNTVEGSSSLRSIASQGSSLVMVTFDLRRDIDTAAQDVRDRVAQVVARLPRDAKPPVISKFDNDSTPVLTLAVSGPRSLRELTEIADKKVKLRIEKAAGVGEVKVVGPVARDQRLGRRRPSRGLRPPDRRGPHRDHAPEQQLPGGNLTNGSRGDAAATMGKLVDAGAFDGS
jgi:HAE1 family hydrophobic/amphiphilic exporter-1